MTSTDEIVVREFQPADLDAVVKLVYRTADISYDSMYCQSAIAHFKEHSAPDRILAEANTGHILVAELDGQVIGTGTVLGSHVTRMYVDPDWQGHGLGRLIVNGLEGHAMAEGIEVMDLYASTVGRPFYERMGYVLTENKSARMEDGGRLDYSTMTKNLNGAPS